MFIRSLLTCFSILLLLLIIYYWFFSEIITIKVYNKKNNMSLIINYGFILGEFWNINNHIFFKSIINLDIFVYGKNKTILIYNKIKNINNNNNGTNR